METSGSGLLYSTIPALAWMEWENAHQLTIVGDPAEIRTWYLPNTNH
jgi:hypothetical protein